MKETETAFYGVFRERNSVHARFLSFFSILVYIFNVGNRIFNFLHFSLNHDFIEVQIYPWYWQTKLETCEHVWVDRNYLFDLFLRDLFRQILDTTWLLFT